MSHDSSRHVEHVICHTIAADMLKCYMSHDSSGHVICHTIAVGLLDMLYVTR